METLHIGSIPDEVRACPSPCLLLRFEIALMHITHITADPFLLFVVGVGADLLVRLPGRGLARSLGSLLQEDLQRDQRTGALAPPLPAVRPENAT